MVIWWKNTFSFNPSQNKNFSILSFFKKSKTSSYLPCVFISLALSFLFLPPIAAQGYDVFMLWNDQIHRFDDAGNLQEMFADCNSCPVFSEFYFGPNDDIVYGRDVTEIFRYDDVTGSILDLTSSSTRAPFIPADTGGYDKPADLTFGPDGNLYASSEDGKEVVRFDGTTGAFSKFVVADANIDFPEFITFGPDNNLYISDSDNEILRYDGTTGVFIDVFVPSGTGGLGDTQGIVFGSDNNLYVVGDSSVLRFNGATGAFIDTFVTAGSGGLTCNDDITFGPDGSLYVVDRCSDSVLRYNGSTGAFIDEFVSAQSGGLNFARDLVFGPDGNLYVGDSLDAAILRYDGTTGAFIDTFVTAGSGGLLGIRGIDFGPDNNLYVGSNTDEVLRYNGSTGAFTDIFASKSGLFSPKGMTIGPDGNLYVGTSGTSEVLRYNPSTGALIDVFVSHKSGSLGNPLQLLFGPDGNLYVLDTGFGEEGIKRYNGSTGAFIDNFVPDGTGGLIIFGVSVMAFGPDGNLYISDNDSFDIKRYDGTTGAFIDVFISGLDSSNPFQEWATGMVFHHDGNLYVNIGNTGDVIERYNASTGAFVDVFATEGAGFSFSGDLKFGPDGNLYVIGSASQSSIIRIDGNTGAFINQAYPKAIYAVGFSKFIDPEIVFGPNGNMYVECEDENAANYFICKFDGKTGAFIETFTPVLSSTDCVDTYRFGPDGRMYLLDFCNSTIERYDGTTGAFIDTFIDGTNDGLGTLSGFAFNDIGELFVSRLDTFANPDLYKVSKHDQTTGSELGNLITLDLGTDCTIFDVKIAEGRFLTRDQGDLCLYDSTGAFISAALIDASLKMKVSPDELIWVLTSFGVSGNLDVIRYQGTASQILFFDKFTDKSVTVFGVGGVDFAPTPDNTRPTITVPADIITQSAGGPKTVAYSVGSSDNIGVTSGPTCTPSSGSSFSVGTTTVECTASDAAGNVRVETFTVTVQVATPCNINTTPSLNTIISSSCSVTISVTAVGNITVQNNSVMRVLDGVNLNIEFTTSNLTVESGSGVLVESGGTIS